MPQVSRRGIRVDEPAPETRVKAGDVVVLGEADSLEAAELRLLRGAKQAALSLSAWNSRVDHA